MTFGSHSISGEITVRTNLVASMVCVGIGVLIGLCLGSDTSDDAFAQDSPAIRQPEPLAGVPHPLEGNPTLIQARPGRDVGASGEIIGFSHVNESGTQVISLVNTGKLWMAVYHVGPDGEIRLVSSRAIDADFSLELNATAPLPENIRRMQGNTKPR
ncbi:hypothetical protein [Rhodopirellula bahusiensis]